MQTEKVSGGPGGVVGVEVEVRGSGSWSSDEEADYSWPTEGGLELERERVSLAELLGEGQFGDVYRGEYRSASSSSAMAVAVKACKLSREESGAEAFLQEAHIMRQFHHPHIIRLVGVCLSSPIWIVMELASLGELRSWLSREGSSLPIPTLILYCLQLSQAMSYLESKSFVHRDVAARNVLVSDPENVKLSDFGLSRWLKGADSYYTSSKGKLPIKWMAVESINFRRFTHASDVWSLGVAMWEVFMLGVKPWAGVRNGAVIGKLEAGERLGMPALCPPRLYRLLNQMWAYDPADRPTVSAVRDSLHEILLLERESPEQKLKRANESLRKLSWGSQDLHPLKSFSMDRRSNGQTLASNGAENNTLPRAAKASSPLPSSSSGSGVGIPLLTELTETQRAAMTAAMARQREQAEEDERWLEQSEQSMGPLSPPPVPKSHQQQISRQSYDYVPTSPPQSSPLLPTPTKGPLPTNGGASEAVGGLALLPPTLPEGMEIDRSDDDVYGGVVGVVKAVSGLSKALPRLEPDEFVSAVKLVGGELRELLRASEKLVEVLPSELSVRVKLSEKVLSSDMASLVAGMKRALQYAATTLDSEYRKAMLSDAHVLAVDSKAFLETADAARHAAHLLPFRPLPCPSQEVSPPTRVERF